MEEKMKLWIIALVLTAIVLIAGIGIASFTSAQAKTVEKTGCGSCSGNCGSEGGCGKASCSATTTGTCGCGKQ